MDFFRFKTSAVDQDLHSLFSLMDADPHSICGSGSRSLLLIYSLLSGTLVLLFCIPILLICIFILIRLSFILIPLSCIIFLVSCIIFIVSCILILLSFILILLSFIPSSSSSCPSSSSSCPLSYPHVMHPPVMHLYPHVLHPSFMVVCLSLTFWLNRSGSVHPVDGGSNLVPPLHPQRAEKAPSDSCSRPDSART